MEQVVLTNQTVRGESLKVVYLPHQGMNLISYSKGSTQVIAQSTRDQFEERFAGLGALIGPHFHHRHLATLPPVPNEPLFPHIARVRAKGTQEPFSHGIGRYAPWKYQATSSSISAQLSGEDEWNGSTLEALEGQSFTMNYRAELTPEGLHIRMDVVSGSDSVVGLHYYYDLPGGAGYVRAKVGDSYNDSGAFKPLPGPMPYTADDHQLVFDLKAAADFGFLPFPDPLTAQVELETAHYQLRIQTRNVSEENSWQLYHPAGSAFVCIEPLSARNPRKAHLSVSGIDVLITIL